MTVLAGLLRGAGRQKLGAIINASVSWGLGLPLQAAFAFRAGLGVTGMWWGAAVATTIQAAVEVRNMAWTVSRERSATVTRLVRCALRRSALCEVADADVYVCAGRIDWSREADRAAELLRESHGEPLLPCQALDGPDEIAIAPLVPVV